MCADAKAAVSKAELAYQGEITVEWVNVSDPVTGAAAATRLFRLLDQYGIKDTPELACFVGTTCLTGATAITESLDEAIRAALANHPVRNDTSSLSRSDTSHRLSLPAITLAGLADGINPCAFATVVLLVSMLTAARRDRRTILMVGMSFTLAVYATSFAVGLLSLGALRSLSGYRTLSDLIYALAFVACIVGAVLSSIDALRVWKTGSADGMKLVLPVALRDRLQKILRRGVHARTAVLGAFGAGVLVCLIESACTGMDYGPILAQLARDGSTWRRGMALLAWYNGMFVAPLVVVFGLAYAGVSNARLAGFSRRHTALVKLFLACVFAAMAVWMAPGLSLPIQH